MLVRAHPKGTVKALIGGLPRALRQGREPQTPTGFPFVGGLAYRILGSRVLVVEGLGFRAVSFGFGFVGSVAATITFCAIASNLPVVVPAAVSVLVVFVAVVAVVAVVPVVAVVAVVAVAVVA